MDRRVMLRLGLIGFAAPLLGCTRDAPARADRSDLPPEVKAEEDAWEAKVQQNIAEREKKSKKGR